MKRAAFPIKWVLTVLMMLALTPASAETFPSQTASFGLDTVGTTPGTDTSLVCLTADEWNAVMYICVSWEALSRLSAYRMKEINQQDALISRLKEKAEIADSIVAEEREKTALVERGLQRANKKVADCEESRSSAIKRSSRRGNALIVSLSFNAALVAAMAIYAAID